MQGDELKALRESVDMTRSELAQALDMSPTFLAYLERGARPIDKRTELAVRYVATMCSQPAWPESEQDRPILSQA